MLVLVYHYFSRSQPGWITCSEQQLEHHVSYLQRRCNVVPLLEGLRALEENQKLSPRTIAITVDDCDQSFYEIAWPIFRKHQVPVFCNVPTAYIGKRLNLGFDVEVIGTDALRSLVDSGLVVLGSHSATHPRFNELSRDRVREELVASRLLVEKIQGHCNVFAYPYGSMSVITADAETGLLDSGYRYALTTCSGRVERGTDRFRIGRTNLGHSAGAFSFPFYCNGFVSRLIKVRKAWRGERTYSKGSPAGRVGFSRTKHAGFACAT